MLLYTDEESIKGGKSITSMKLTTHPAQEAGKLPMLCRNPGKYDLSVTNALTSACVFRQSYSIALRWANCPINELMVKPSSPSGAQGQPPCVCQMREFSLPLFYHSSVRFSTTSLRDAPAAMNEGAEERMAFFQSHGNDAPTSLRKFLCKWFFHYHLQQRGHSNHKSLNLPGQDYLSVFVQCPAE